MILLFIIFINQILAKTNRRRTVIRREDVPDESYRADSNDYPEGILTSSFESESKLVKKRFSGSRFVFLP